MDNKKIQSVISNMEALLEELKKLLVVNTDNALPERSVPTHSKVKRQTGKESPTKILNSLIKKGYFSTPRTANEVQKELKKTATSMKNSSLLVTLMRLVKKETLERDGDGTSKNPWRYKTIS